MVLFVKYGVPWGQFRASGTSMNSLSFSPTPLHITTYKPVRLSQNFPTGSGGVRKSTDPLMPESPPNTEHGSSFSWYHYLCIWTTYDRRRAILLNSPAISSPFETSTHGGGISITVARPSIFNTIYAGAWVMTIFYDTRGYLALLSSRCHRGPHPCYLSSSFFHSSHIRACERRGPHSDSLIAF